MSQHTGTDEVVVWLGNGLPRLLVWNAVRYRISDTPTPLQEDVWHPSLTHGARRLVGWRFQATTANGVSRMFEVEHTDGGWRLLRSYD